MHDLLAVRRRHQAWQHGGGARLGSAAAQRGVSAATPRAAAVAMKTPAATAIAGAQTINNQLKGQKQGR